MNVMQCLWASSPLQEHIEHIEHTEEQEKQEKQEKQEQVHWIVQFYVDKSAARQQEILFCLQQNVRNKYITHVHLLNERHYTDDELGIKEANVKIVQTVLGKRATYRDVFAYVRRAGLQGYVCFANSDMVLEEADVPRLFRSSLSTRRQCLALLRYECDLLQVNIADRDQTIGNVRLFGPRYDSQDVWILHASQLFPPAADRAFSFSFGVPGCDNKVVYVLQALLGYEVINDPLAIRTYHVHASQVRHYTAKDALPRPFGALVPFGLSSQCRDSLGMMTKHAWFTQHPSALQARLRLSLEKEKETHVATTVLSGLATTMAVYMCIASTTTDHGLRHSLLSFVQQYQAHMAAQEGVVVRTTRAVKAYSDAVLASWQAMTVVFSEDANGALYQSNQLAYDWLHQSGTCPQDKVHWPGLLESWHVSSFPKREEGDERWIQSIVGQRRLAVVSSAYGETLLQGQFAKRASFTYNQVDLFPGSTLVACVVGPDAEEEEGELTTAGDNQVKKEDEKNDKKKDKKEKKKKADADRNFDSWWPRYCEQTLLPLCRREDVDVVLVSCRGYGPLVVHYVSQHGKTALDFGPYLGNWFGCFTASDLRARPDAFRLVLNADWVKCIG